MWRFFLETNSYIETLPNGVKHQTTYKKKVHYKIPKNIKCRPDIIFYLEIIELLQRCRYLDSVGYVNSLNLVGEAKLIFFSNDTNISSLLKFWNLNKSFRFKRTFKKL